MEKLSINRFNIHTNVGYAIAAVQAEKYVENIFKNKGGLNVRVK